LLLCRPALTWANMSSTEQTSPTTIWASSSTTMHPMIEGR
jgi:hypothetical protein